MKTHIGEIGLSLLIGGVVAVISILFTKLTPLWIATLAIIAGVVFMVISHFWWKIVKPLKLKATELTCWHIERPEPEHHMWTHCHEYNFTGKISILAQIKANVTEFYLEIPMRSKPALTVKSQIVPPDVLSKLMPDEPIVNNYFFQIRLEKEIKIPSRAYIIMKSNNSTVKCKVLIKVNDEYRPPIEGVS